MNQELPFIEKLKVKRVFLEFEKERLSQLDENRDDINLITKIKRNIKLYEKEIVELEVRL